MRIVEQYLLQLKNEKRRWRRAAAILTVLSLLVASGVSWNLRMTGITIANGTTCGQEEHQHTEECPMERVLICGYDDEIATEDPTDTPSNTPSDTPTDAPTDAPADTPSDTPADTPTDAPADAPADTPTDTPTDTPSDTPADTPTDTSTDTPADTSTDTPVDTPADTPVDTPTDTQETPVLDAVMNVVADVFSGFVLTAYAAELPEEYLPDDTTSGHIHTDECYEITWLCGIEEHVHAISCYSDTTADIESAVIWEADLPELTDNWADDYILIAQSQLGCGESERNYILAVDGETKNGITRYGQWYGNPYGDWSGMFTLFCLNYANIPRTVVPQSPGVYNMMSLAQDAEIFLQPDENIGTIGNLLFLDTDENDNADRIVVVCEYEDEELTAIGGDLENTVAEITLSDNEPCIMGYINLSQLHATWEAAQEEPPHSESIESDTEEPTDEPMQDEPTQDEPTQDEPTQDEPTQDEPTQDEPTQNEASDRPTITLDVEITEDGILRLIAHTSNIEEGTYLWQWQVSEDGNKPWTDIDGAAELVCDLENTEENFNRYYRLQGQKVPVMRMFALRAVETDADSSGTSEDGDTIISEPIAPFSIGKDWSNNYTIDVYAVATDENKNPIPGISMTTLSDITVNSETKISIESVFNDNLGQFHSAYFGTSSNVQVDDISAVWRTSSGGWWATYYLAYEQTDGTTVTQWKSNADNSISLYIRYIPQFTITFASEGFTSLTEKVLYNGFTTLTEPTWTREGHTLIGWTINGNEQTVYTFEEIKQMPITENVTYTAKWANEVTVSFNLGEYANDLHPIDPIVVPYGSTVSNLPTPTWKNNAVTMSFDGWYLNEALTYPVNAEHKFLEDTVLYAKWSPKDDGYFVYFMDFAREGQVPLVLVTYSVTEGRTVYPYTPGNAPADTAWNGIWYLEDTCTNAYNFSIPVSNMTDYLTGAKGRDLYLYPGTVGVCRAIFVTYGTRVDPITVPIGGTVNLDLYEPERNGFTFAGWTLQDGTPVSGVQTLNDTTTFVATWEADYVPFEAVLRIENANDTAMTQAEILGTWYAKAGSQIRVKSTYTGTGDNRQGTHEVVCVLDGKEYAVYKNAGLTQKATLNDVYATYFIYNNTGTNWTDEVNWDDVFTGGEVPYSTRHISSAGDTIINFDYMRVRTDIVFTITNSNSGGYIDVYKLYRDGLITGSVTYTDTKPTSTGQNVSATGVSAENISWSYTAASRVGSSYNNYYTLHDMKYGQRIYEVYPVGGSWLTARNAAYHQYNVDGGAMFASRRQDLTSDFFKGSGRGVSARSLTTEFSKHEYIALMYAVECLDGETADFTIDGVDYKVDTELCEVVKHTGFFSIKALDGCTAGVNALGTYSSNNKYYTANTIPNDQKNYAVNIENAKLGGTSVKTLFNETYWSYYSKFSGVSNLNTFSKIYIFYYDRMRMDIQFNFGYDSDGNGTNETVKYENIAYGEKIDEYQFGKPGYAEHSLLDREGYEFAGWMDANGFVMEAEDWASLIASGDSENNTMIFIAKWEKISSNIVEYYEDRSSTEPFESHYFEDGELVPYPTMTVYPQGWVWQEYGDGQFQRFDWDVPMYGEYGVQEVREINGEERVVNVIRIYGTWDESHTKVVYDPNAPQGGIPGSAPLDPNEYTLWQSEVPVVSRGDTANADPDMVFVGWQLDRNGIVYQPGDHVPVQWPRTMIFTAQWAKAEEIVHLRYDPNGGTPEDIYPNESGFAYKKNATAAVWDNMSADGATWFKRTGYIFTGWNTEPDGSGTAYAPNAHIQLTAPMTTLYAQWKPTTYTLSLYKIDSDTSAPLTGAVFKLYKQENGNYLLLNSLTTGADGHITFQNLETDTLYKLIEDTPPNGYAMITKEIFFALRPNGNIISHVFYDSKGNEISAPNSVSAEYITGDQLLTVTVKNLRGYELPSTGGPGIFFNILCGLFLVTAPLVYGLRLRRKYERRSRK